MFNPEQPPPRRADWPMETDAPSYELGLSVSFLLLCTFIGAVFFGIGVLGWLAYMVIG